jgi:hypothetical protein
VLALVLDSTVLLIVSATSVEERVKCADVAIRNLTDVPEVVRLARSNESGQARCGSTSIVALETSH